eukprot:m.16670 g.16670  ORF g.16670 m.16670 type:complete len:526 (-) comp5304_c0_seq1:76-1653(-)
MAAYSEEEEYLSDEEVLDEDLEPLFVARVVYPFEGTCDVELTLEKNDVVTVYRDDVGGGWWEGEKDGLRGLFPSSYCTKVDAASAPAGAATTVQASSVGASAAAASAASPSNKEAATAPATSKSANPQPAPRGKRSAAAAAASSTSASQSSHQRTPSVTALEAASPDLRYSIEEGGRWGLIGEPFEVTAKTNPNKGSKFSGIKQFTTYEITSSSTAPPVNRRFKHFAWLHQRLSDLFPGICVPPLPDKQMQGRFDAKFIEQRRRQLQRFLNRVAEHPVLGSTSVFRHFLTTTDQKEWKSGKRAAEHKASSSYLGSISLPDSENTDVEVVMSKFVRFSSWLEKHTAGLSKACDEAFSEESTGWTHVAEALKNVADAHTRPDLYPWWDSGAGQAEFERVLSALEMLSSGFEKMKALTGTHNDSDRQLLGDVFREYNGILHAFPQTVKAFEAAQHDAKPPIQPDQIESARARYTQMKFVCLAELRHFHEHLVKDWHAMMQHYVAEQVRYHREAAAVWERIGTEMETAQ